METYTYDILYLILAKNMKKLIFATHNNGKLEEMRQILSGLPLEVISAEEAGVFEDPEETGETFAENALLKAKFVTAQTGEWSVADDSGLCIAALNGQPGVKTARWAGKGASGKELVEFTIQKLFGVPENKRQAYFESVAALVGPNGEEQIFTGKIAGSIALAPMGEAHEKLPYDAVFIPEGSDATFAQIPAEVKNAMSHRGLAFKQLRNWLEQVTANI